PESQRPRSRRHRLDGQALRPGKDARHRPAVHRMSAVLQKPLGNVSAFHAIFFDEADEHLASVESLLLALDPAAPNAEALNGIFRAVHSIKGSAGMLGFPEIVQLTHVFENLLDILRKKERPLAREDVDAMLRAGDVVKTQVAFARGMRKEAPDISAAEA